MSILILGEAWGEDELAKREPFQGSDGRFLRALLHRAGININQCYLTNVFNLVPRPSKDISNLCGPKETAIPGMPRLANSKYVQIEYAPELDRLYKEIDTFKPNVVIALGGTAAWAMCKTSGVKKIRGAPLLGRNNVKVLPTYHPSAVLKEYNLWPILLADLEKAKRQSEYPELVRPARSLWLDPTLEDIAAFEQFILGADKLSVDIETWAGQITCVGFAPSPDRAIVIPFCIKSKKSGNYWDRIEDELEAWAFVRKWLKMKPVLGQNFLYDANYLWSRYGLTIPHFEHDTMLLHHSLQPEMEKGLGFLGSIYTDEPSWKFMRHQETFKKEE